VSDCCADLAWTSEQPKTVNIDASTHRRIDASAVVVVGISAGGGLAAGAVLMARDQTARAYAGRC